MQLNDEILDALQKKAFESTKIPVLPGSMTMAIHEEREFWFKCGWGKAIATVLKLMEMAEGKG